MATSTPTAEPAPARTSAKPDRCPTCGKVLFDGYTLLARVTRVHLDHADAKCPRCKGWVRVAVRLG